MVAFQSCSEELKGGWAADPIEFSGDQSSELSVGRTADQNIEDPSKQTFAAMLEIEQQRNQMFGAVVTLEQQNKKLLEELETIKSESQRKDVVIQQSDDTISTLTQQKQKLVASQQFIENTSEINMQLRNELLLVQQQIKNERKSFEQLLDQGRRENQTLIDQIDVLKSVEVQLAYQTKLN